MRAAAAAGPSRAGDTGLFERIRPFGHDYRCIRPDCRPHWRFARI